VPVPPGPRDATDAALAGIRVKCTHTSRTGRPCPRLAEFGELFCKGHLNAPRRAEAAARVQDMRDEMSARVSGAVVAAFTTIVDIMQNGSNEMSRLKAAQQVMAWAGYGPEQRIVVVTEGLNTDTNDGDRKLVDIITRIDAQKADLLRSRLGTPTPNEAEATGTDGASAPVYQLSQGSTTSSAQTSSTDEPTA
jgi:hypothetical protein